MKDLCHTYQHDIGLFLMVRDFIEDQYARKVVTKEHNPVPFRTSKERDKKQMIIDCTKGETSQVLM